MKSGRELGDVAADLLALREDARRRALMLLAQSLGAVGVGAMIWFGSGLLFERVGWIYVAIPGIGMGMMIVGAIVALVAVVLAMRA